MNKFQDISNANDVKEVDLNLCLMLQEYLSLQAKKKEIEDKLKEYKAVLFPELDGYKKVRYKGMDICKIVYISKKDIDVKALKEKYPEIAKQVEKTVSYFYLKKV